MQYSERWYLQSTRKFYNPQSKQVVNDTVSGISRAYEYSLNTGLSTKIYGIKTFKKGNLLALRHVMTPSVTMSYRPDFSKSNFGFSGTFRIRRGNLQRYSIFDNTLYGGPGAGRVGSIGFSLDNNVEAKVRSKSDTSTAVEKIPIIQGLSFSGNYNLAADKFKLSSIGFAGRTSFFKQKFGVNFYGTLDPYQVDGSGNRINEYLFKAGRLARLTQFGLSFDFSLNSDAAKRRNDNIQQANENKSNMSAEQAEDLARISRDPNAFVDFNVPWNISASYSFNYSKPLLTSSIANTVNLYGDVSVTPKWKIQYNSGFDFQTKKISITQFSIYRDLHCWDLSIRWVPFGTYQSYSVDLRVKASILQDLKLSRRRDYYNNF